MRESLKQQLDESVPVDVTLTEMKKRQILKAAQVEGGGRKISRVPKVLPALAGVAVIGLSGVLAYPYLIEDEPNIPAEIRTGEENQVPADGNNEEPELPVAGDEEVIEEQDKEKDMEEDAEKDVEQTKDEVDESLEDTPEEPVNQTDEITEDESEEAESPPLTKQDELYQLFNHEFFATGIELGDKVAEIESNYPNWIEKGEVEGGLVTSYGSYMIIYPHFEEHINYVALMEFNQLTVTQIEEVIGQEIVIETHFDEIYSRDVISGKFILENKSYFIVADSESEDAKVNQIWMSEYVEE